VLSITGINFNINILSQSSQSVNDISFLMYRQNSQYYTVQAETLNYITIPPKRFREVQEMKKT
jgi:hypothetical protein